MQSRATSLSTLAVYSLNDRTILSVKPSESSYGPTSYSADVVFHFLDLMFNTSSKAAETILDEIINIIPGNYAGYNVLRNILGYPLSEISLTPGFAMGDPSITDFETT